MTNPVETATGESMSSLIWMAVGAAAGILVGPLVASYLGISPVIATVLVGAALAYFASGAMKKLGQGAALYSIVSLAVGFLGPIFGGLVGGNAQPANDHPGIFLR